MLRKILLIVVVSLFVFGMSKLSFAMMCGDHSGSQQLTQAHSEHEHGPTGVTKEAGLSEQTENVNNKICPVSGEKIDEKMKATYEYEGKIYNFCCPDCVNEFKKDPEAYIKKVEEELKAQSKEETQEKVEPASMMPEEHEHMHH